MSAFSSYKVAKKRISTQCDDVENAWKTATTSSEFEELVAGGERDESSEVENLLLQSRQRLASDTIEVGIFGEIKRGKSTLINALVGQRVSSMRVTPETAVPVWVERGEPRTVVIYSDGSSGEVADPHLAQEMATQRAESGIGKNVMRVVQYTEVAWLPDGLRIVDTPGLQDPSLVESYESRTMDELERVSAAVFMFISPPGPASHEVQVLRRLASHGIDKVFLVCNFYPDVWSDDEDRNDVLNYIKKVVVDAAIAASKNAPKDIKLYGINARDALRAIESGDEDSYRLSGVAALRDDIEDYLVNGALNAVMAGAQERLHLAASMVSRTLDQREIILKDPTRIARAVTDLENAVQASARELGEIEQSLQVEGERIGRLIGDVLASPYEKAIGMIAASSSIAEIKAVVAGLENLVTGAHSRAATEFERATSAVVRKAENQLLNSFGSTDSFAGVSSRSTSLSPSIAPPTVGSVTTRINWSEVMSAGALTGLGGAAVGGSVAGGAGLALLATGPVGWLIGALSVGIIGLLGGSVMGIMSGVNKVRAEDRKRISEDLSRMLREARDYGVGQGISWGNAVASKLRSQRDRYVGDKTRELQRVQKIVGDSAARERALKTIANARKKLDGI